VRSHPFILTVLVILISGLTSGDSAQWPHQEACRAFSMEELCDGDLVFRRGRSPESHAVLIGSPGNAFSHVGMVVREQGQAWVIHAVPGENGNGPDFIRRESLAEFLAFKKASRFAVYRADFPDSIRTRAADAALSFFREQRLFDNRYDLETDDRLYCTELVLKAFGQANAALTGLGMTELDLVFGKISLLFPGNLIENPHFHLIALQLNSEP